MVITLTCSYFSNKSDKVSATFTKPELLRHVLSKIMLLVGVFLEEFDSRTRAVLK